ncbi:MAG: hypothetical protein E7375_00005, partial [Clostridiales bacterium]|nr:hypothetical protein [Clostridiales bacterium]
MSGITDMQYGVSYTSLGKMIPSLATVSIDATGSGAQTYNGTISRANYDFGGWYTKNGAGGDWGYQVFDANGNLQKGVSGISDSTGKWLYVGELQLYAKWTLHNYKLTITRPSSSVTNATNITLSAEAGTLGATALAAGASTTLTATFEDGTITINLGASNTARKYLVEAMFDGEVPTRKLLEGNTLSVEWTANADATLYLTVVEAFNVSVSKTTGVSASTFDWTFDSEYKGTNETSNTKVLYGSELTFKATLADGYNFNGWYNGETRVSTSLTYSIVGGISQDMALTAKAAAKNVAVTFSSNISTNYANDVYSVNPTTKTITFNQKYGTLATATRTGYTFGGWFTTTACTGTAITADTTFNNVTVANAGSQTLYAKWTANSLAVNYELTKITIASAPTSVSAHSALSFTMTSATGYSLPNTIIVKVGSKELKVNVGYTYNSTTGAVTINAGYINEAVTVTAVAGADTNRVTYNLTHITTSGASTAISGTTYSAVLSREYGYTMPTTIAVTINGKTATVNTDYTYVSDANGDKYTLTIKGEKVVGDITITAAATVKAVAITLDANGGEISNTSINKNFGDSYGTLPTPTMTGYNFGGWYKVDYAIDATVSSANKVESSTKITNEVAHTLYAYWTKASMTVYVDVYGDTYFSGTASVVATINGTQQAKQSTTDSAIQLTLKIGDKIELSSVAKENFGNYRWKKTTDGLEENVVIYNGSTLTYTISAEDFEIQKPLYFAHDFTYYWNRTAVTNFVEKDVTGGQISRSGESEWSDYQTSSMPAYYSSHLYAKAKTGYSFYGWYLRVLPTEDNYDSGIAIATVSSDRVTYNEEGGYYSYRFDPQDVNPYDSKIGGGDFYALFLSNEYDITLSQTDATTTGTASVTATYGVSTRFTITNPQRTGYTFAGWKLSNGTKLINVDGTLVANVSGYTDANGKWVHDGDVTVSAMWTINEYTLTINVENIAVLNNTNVSITTSAGTLASNSVAAGSSTTLK